jgi:hypothetical protein
MAMSENAEELEVAVELQDKPKLIDPPASFRSAVWKYFDFPEVTGTLRTDSEPKYGSNESKIELDENIAVHRKFGESFHLYFIRILF